MILNNLFLISIRRLVYFLLALIDNHLDRTNQLVVLSYHSIANDDWRFSVDVAMFKSQILHISQTHRHTTLNEVHQILTEGRQVGEKLFVVTFDDGYADILRVRKFLAELKIRPTLFLLADPKQADYGELTTNRTFLTKEEIKSLISEGWEIGCHSLSHADFWKLDSEKINAEVVKAKQILELDLQQNVNYFAYPKGRYTPEIVKTVNEAGYQLGLTMDDAFITNKTDRLVLPRVGVDRSHSYSEFKWIYSPSNVLFRALLKSAYNFTFKNDGKQSIKYEIS